MYIERSDDLKTEIFNFKIVHGAEGVRFLHANNFNQVPTITKDLHIVKITDKPYQNPYDDLYETSDKINFTRLKLPSFRCFIDKVEPLLEFIKTIDSKYVMYMDASDTVLVSDITDPQGMLDSYNCKVLFNAEDGYPEPDHPCKNKNFLKAYTEKYNCEENRYYIPERNNVIRHNKSEFFKICNSVPFVRSLNAGLFMGERDYLIDILSEALSIMSDDVTKGYPFGEIDDQKVWQYLQTKRSGIGIDYLNHYFLWIHHNKWNYPPTHWEHFNYFNKLHKNGNI